MQINFYVSLFVNYVYVKRKKFFFIPNCWKDVQSRWSQLIDIPQTKVLHDGRLFGLAEHILRVVLHPELRFNLVRKSWPVGAGHEHGPRVSKEKVAPILREYLF